MANEKAPLAALNDDAGETVMEWARQNQKPLAIGSIVVAAIAVVAVLWSASAAKKEANASRALMAHEATVRSGNIALAQSDLRDFLGRYSGTKAAINGRILLAKVYLDDSKVDSAIATLDQVGSPGPFAVSFNMIRGSALEQANRPAEAAAAYEAAAAGTPSDATKASLLADAARAYQTAGQVDDARRIWTAIAADDSSPMAGEARVRLGELNAKPIS